ncbi:MAG: UDP-2,3-diacylglucosamine diphosphatase [Planctomycetota bacterium]
MTPAPPRSGKIPAASGAPPLELGARRCWFFTDLHLRAGEPREVQAFVGTLSHAPADLECLVIMGDLFDAWVGPAQWKEPAFQPLAAALVRLGRQGVRVVLLRGNRDVLLEPGDGARVGAEVADGVLLETAGGKILVTHGDEYCLRDAPYQRLRRWFRRRWVRGLIRVLPYALRRWCAARMRAASRQAVARKPLDVLALEVGAIPAALEAQGAVQALIGHLHVARETALEGGKSLRILPAWSPETLPVEKGGGAQG